MRRLSVVLVGLQFQSYQTTVCCPGWIAVPILTDDYLLSWLDWSSNLIRRLSVVLVGLEFQSY